MKPRSREELRDAIYHGAVKRVRPKMMTVACAFFGLVPIMWSTGAGADVMKRIAAPMIGGLFTSFLMELLVYPAIYYRWKVRYCDGDFDETTLRGARVSALTPDGTPVIVTMHDVNDPQDVTDVKPRR